PRLPDSGHPHDGPVPRGGGRAAQLVLSADPGHGPGAVPVHGRNARRADDRRAARPPHVLRGGPGLLALSARAASSSPSAGANLKPCPLHAEPTTTCPRRSSTKLWSGVFV